MWDVMVAAAQAPALQWTVIAVAMGAFVWKLATSTDGVLWGDIFADDVEEHI
jgi:hypothetical protein